MQHCFTDNMVDRKLYVIVIVIAVTLHVQSCHICFKNASGTDSGVMPTISYTYCVQNRKKIVVGNKTEINL